MHLTFSISIAYEEWINIYNGSANAVIVTADNGKTLQLPASAFHAHLLHNGIHGRFVVYFDQNHKLIELKRLVTD